jgi:hypothetical protein
VTSSAPNLLSINVILQKWQTSVPKFNGSGSVEQEIKNAGNTNSNIEIIVVHGRA